MTSGFFELEKECSREHIPLVGEGARVLKMSVEKVSSLAVLRARLGEKFPGAHRKKEKAELRELGGLSFPRGALSEVVCEGPSAGGALFISRLMEEEGEGLPLALIDGADSFDPASYAAGSLPRVLWVRCGEAAMALRAADLLLGDGNLPLVLVDLSLNPVAQLQKIPASSWYRLRSLSAGSGSTLLALTPRAVVPAPARRVVLKGGFDLGDLFGLEFGMRSAEFGMSGGREAWVAEG